MNTKFESPSFTSLLAEQEAVQEGAFQGRQLAEYESYIFPGRILRRPRSDAVIDFLAPMSLTERPSLIGLLEGYAQLHEDRQVSWADMGGGRGLAMRAVATRHELAQRIHMTNVDLFDHGLSGLMPEEMTALEVATPNITHDETAPLFIHADAETVQLPEPADIITSIELLQYLNNPLTAMANWYNQLADGGVMIISTEHNWTTWIRYSEVYAQHHYNETPTKHLLDALSAAGVQYAATRDLDNENGFRPKLQPDNINTLAVKKNAGTRMIVHSDVTKVWVNPSNFKATYYNLPKGAPLIEIVPSE